MSKWSKFSQKASTEDGGATTPHWTMHLRQIKKANGEVTIEQLIEHRNNNQMVVSTEWVELPTLYEENV